MSLYKELMKGISYSIKQSLNEMARNIDYRTLDRKLWLSVASVCSRNKATECELVRPMKKLTKDDLINRYVAALIIMKKSCPKNERDIDKIKVFKLFGHRILELGGTIDEIQQLYNVNMDISSSVKQNKVTSKSIVNEPTVNTPIKKTGTSRSTINKKFITLFESLIKDLPKSMYDDKDLKLTYVGNYNKPYNKCKSEIQKYVNSLFKKSHNNFDNVVNTLRDNVIAVNKLNKVSNNDLLLEVRQNVGERKRGWDYFYQCFTLQIKPESYDIFVFNKTASFAPNADRQNFKEKFDPNSLYKYNLTSFNLFSKKPNLIDGFSEAVFMYIIKPYLNYKVNADQELNAGNSEETLLKYNMDVEPNNYFKWVKDNIKDILKNNPDKLINVNYSDWSGAIKSLLYNTDLRKFIVQCYLQSGSSDMDKSDVLINLIKLSSSDTYRNTYYSDNAYAYRDSDDATYTCVVKDLNAFGEKLFNVIKEDIIKGKLV